MDIEILNAILLLLAGVGVFIVACNILSSNIEAVSSNKLKALFARAADKKLVGVGIGTLSTAVIQSSAATIVLVIGFVNAGVMGLSLASTIIYGANIGTTITAWITAIGTVSANSISLTILFSALAGIGAFLTLFTRKPSLRNKFGIFTGFGLIFVGLMIMSNSMKGLAGSEEIRNFISSITNVFLLIFIGFALTAMTQSSSVTTAIMISMLPVSGAATGLLSLEQAIYMTLGANIGSCVIVLVSGFAGSLDAKRASLAHLFFNIFGVIVFVIAGLIMGIYNITYADVFSGLLGGVAGLQLALFHTTLNVVTTILILPLTKPMLKFIVKITPESRSSKLDKPHLFYIDKLMLSNPPVAIQQLKREIVNMAGIAKTNFDISINMIKTLNFDRKEEFDRNENELDFLAWEISKYLMELSNRTLSNRDRIYVSSAYRTISDLERVGDYAENITEYSQKLVNMNGSFTDIAKGEIDQMKTLVDDLYELILKAYKNLDEKTLEEAFDVEEKIDVFTEEMSNNHTRRLNDGICTLDVGVEYLALASDSERIADHFMNVGKTIRDII